MLNFQPPPPPPDPVFTAPSPPTTLSAPPAPPTPPCPNHVKVVNVGSPNVYVVGIKTARIGDSTDSGAMTTGSGNVFANG